jgi:hypothetical protein
VFGDDDIPYIVEKSGLELADDIDGVMGIRDDDEVGELEALEDGEDLEEVDEPESETESQGSPNQPRGAADIASQIEFGASEGEEMDEGTEEDFEIVSPFATMLSRFDKNNDTVKSSKEPEPKNIKTSGKLEELSPDYSMSLVYKPFQTEEKSSPDLLKPLSAEEVSVIKEQNGVNYVDEKVKTPDAETEKKLDPGLRDLVDSVIKNN